MEEEYIPHQNLEDPDHIIANSKLIANDIFSNSTNNFNNLNKSMKDQNDYLNNLNQQIEENLEQNSSEMNENLNLLGGDTDNLKFTIYQKLNDVSNQLLQAKEHIKFLTQENASLKNIIANKDKLITDFEELSLQSKYKFEKMEMINQNLKRQLQQKGMNNNNNEVNMNNNINEIGEKNRNEEIIYNLQNIQEDLDNIETDYQKKLKEKDICIEQLNTEIVNIYQEYMKLSDILEELNYLLKNSDYNELKTQFSCLLREKEILLREKERNHMEIINLREKFLKRPCSCGNNQEKINELAEIFDLKEKKYLDEIESLKKNLREKIVEIEELKKEEEDIVRDYELKIGNIMSNNMIE